MTSSKGEHLLDLVSGGYSGSLNTDGSEVEFVKREIKISSVESQREDSGKGCQEWNVSESALY